MQPSIFIEAWLLWLRPYPCLATPFNMLANRWMECVLPRAAVSRPDAVRRWMEQWWRLTGVVPRSLYLEVLEKKEVLRTRLEEAEATIQQLRAANAQATQGKEIEQTWETAIDLWQTAVHTTVKAQHEWMRTWTDFAFNNHQRG
jgi:hypothetical protein